MLTIYDAIIRPAIQGGGQWSEIRKYRNRAMDIQIGASFAQ